MSTITLSGDPDGEKAGRIESDGDGYVLIGEDGEEVGTLTESDLDALTDTAQSFADGEEGDAPEFEGTAALGQIGGPPGMMLQAAGHDALVLFNEDEESDGPIVLFNTEDVLGAQAAA